MNQMNDYENDENILEKFGRNINEQVKNENGLIVRSGKFGPFESCAEIDYFINFKREKVFN